ncbi:sodium:solute symporter family transporter [Halegenticoccus soli]|uniref:sodium:solute symporter family transporter n=1 Tax=Halegenticoccus soli TaxID=1985678 RepID=UPI000C6E4A2F|nr:sodium:proline symporter [Halegenticoccus soli]
MVSAAVALGLSAVLLVGFGAVGAWYARGRLGSVEDFITARNSVGGGALTATIVASSMGAWILFSPAEAGAAFGGITAVFGYAAGSALALAAYALVGPRIRRLLPEGHSLTEYAHARYGGAMYAYVLVVTVSYMFVFLAAEFTGVALALSLLAGVPPWQTAALVGGTVFAYTAYGGLRASVTTDVLQALFILPLFVVAVVATFVAVGGPVEAHAAVAASRPDLLALGSLSGLRFGVYVVVAIVGAEMLNQAWWQRVYAARDERTLRRSFGLSALAVLPVIVLVGLFGPLAAGLGLVSAPADASVALFLVAEEALPSWAVLAFVLLAVLLVASSADTLFNAIASVITADVPRLLDVDERRLTAVARLFTAVVALAATIVGAQGYSVLTLFLLADLLASATFVPLLLGLYAPKASSAGALGGSALGLAAGLAFFPPARGVLSIPALPDPSFLASFLAAAGVSALVSLAAARANDEEYDLSRLARDVRRFDDSADGALADGGPSRSADSEK